MFKSAIVYRFTKPIELSREAVEQGLSLLAFKDPDKTQFSSCGFFPPLPPVEGDDEQSPMYLYEQMGIWLVCLKSAKRKINTAEADWKTSERVKEIQAKEYREVGGKEKQDIKDEELAKLLPNTYPTPSRTFAVIVPESGLLIVDSSTFEGAEVVIRMLRKAFGTFSVMADKPMHDADKSMSTWLLSCQSPDSEELDFSFPLMPGELQVDDKAVFKANKGADKAVFEGDCLYSGDAIVHLTKNFRCQELRLLQMGRRNEEDDAVMRFVLLGDMRIKSIKVLASIHDDEDANLETQAARFDAELVLFAGTFLALWELLIKDFGGSTQEGVTWYPDDYKDFELPAKVIEENTPGPVGEEVQEWSERPGGAEYQGEMALADGPDGLYDEAVAFVVETRKASISAVQRKLRIGYNRSARLIEAMEAAGVVSPMGANGTREVLVTELTGEVA